MNSVTTFGFASALAAGGIACMALAARRRGLAHWALAAGMLLLAADMGLAGLTLMVPAREPLVFWQRCRLPVISLLPGTWLLFSLTYARENWRGFLARWRFGVLAAFLLPATVAAFGFSRLVLPPGAASSGPRTLALGPAGVVLYLLVLLGAALVLVNLERTFRAATGARRWHIKSIVAALGTVFAVRVYGCGQVLMFSELDLNLQALNAGTLLLVCLLLAPSLLRGGDFGAQVYVSESASLQSMTAVATALYLLMIGVVATLLSAFHGANPWLFCPALVVLGVVGLCSVLLSERMRSHALRFFRRNFQRPRYDYRTIWRVFNDSRMRQLEPPDLARAIVTVVADLFDALSVSLWVVSESKARLVFAASTRLAPGDAEEFRLNAEEATELLAILPRRPEPVDIDQCREPWAGLLRRFHPCEGSDGGQRICVPMVVRGKLVGLLMLGDRVGAPPYSLEEFELLKTVSDQAGASFFSLQLAHKLTQAKQFEAFQTMSAFFVHDLKNTASTLSLMLQNLPTHFNDPAFREDALRAIGKTVNHINELISRLSLLRKELALKCSEVSLNLLVADALEGLELAAGAEMLRELEPVPMVWVDREQMRTVVTNLVLNARDALGPRGTIRVQTRRHNGWVVLSVADTGCGMTPDFVDRKLFQPFQTTKSKGIGIGLYQCKMIVEAHHGKIEVESHPGKGTVFRVLLPPANPEPPLRLAPCALETTSV